MLKKLLVAVLALTIFIGLYSPALATRTLSEGQQLETPELVPDEGFREVPYCVRENYATTGYLYYLFGLPDAYGDDYFNMRFTNETACSLTQTRLYFRGPNLGDGSTAGVGATIYLWNSQPSGFPNLGSVIYSVPVNPIPFGATGSGSVRLAINLRIIPGGPPVLQGNFNVGYSPIVNVPGQVCVTGADANGTAGGRSSEFWGLWGTMLADWGVDCAFLFDVDKCCAAPLPYPECQSSANPLDEWPIWCHDFGRSSQSGITLGTDLCRLTRAWVYNLGFVDGAYQQMARTSPLISDDKVYVFFTGRVICLDLTPVNPTGDVVWTSMTKPWGIAVTALNSDPAIVDGYLYMGTGSAVAGGPAGFIKVNAATGDLVWGRGAGLGTALEGGGGATTCAPPVIIGEKVFFGNQSGNLFALDKATGATLYYHSLTVTPTSTITAKMMSSISSDGTNLFVGTANVTTVPPALGCVYSFLPGVSSFTQNWVYDQPAGVIATWPGGFFSAPSYRGKHLFINSIATYNGANGYCGYRQDLNPATGAAQWFTDMAMGGARQSPPATFCTPYGVTAVFANYITAGYQGNGYARGVRAVNEFNSTIWSNPGGANWENQVYVHASLTQDPWVFYGANDAYAQNAYNPYGGNWIITNGNTGAITMQYALTGYIHGTAIAHGSDGKDYVVVVTQFSNNNPSAGGGLVLAFNLRDTNRPRLVVPLRYFAFPSTNDDEAGIPMTVQRTAVGAIRNVGCADMTWSGVLDDGVVAKIRTVSSAGEQKAADLAANLIDRTVDDLTPFNEPSKSKLLVNSLLQNEEGDWYMPVSQVKPAIANSARLATPDWVVWVNPVSGTGTVLAGASANFTFEFDLTKMNKLGVNNFYVVIETSDPDYNAEIPPGTPQGVQSDILYSMPYMYCGIDIVEGLYFGDVGVMWANNIGLLGDADIADEFAPDPAHNDVMFSGSMFYCNDMPSAAWNPIAGDGSWSPLVDGGFLFGFYVTGDDCGGCLTNTTLPVRYINNPAFGFLTGDICSFAFVDSGQDMGYYPNQDGPSMGILVKSREIGIYGADFADFKLTVQTIINRNATPINGLYYGAFVDWDVSGADEGTGDAEKGYIFQYGAGAAYGFIGLPSKGSYWPDGVKTDPMYNGHILHSADDYWDNEQFDSLYSWNDDYPEGSITIRPVETPGTDRAMHLAFGKTDLGDHGEHTFGFATFGLTAYSSPTDVDNLRKFVNKLAGFGRGDIDNNDVIDLRDLVRLVRYVNNYGWATYGPTPFYHLGDVDCNGTVNIADCTLLKAYFFTGGPPPKSKFVF